MMIILKESKLKAIIGKSEKPRQIYTSYTVKNSNFQYYIVYGTKNVQTELLFDYIFNIIYFFFLLNIIFVYFLPLKALKINFRSCKYSIL